MSDSRPKPEEIILYEKDPKTKIATITFNRPEYLNAPTSMARLRYADLLRAATVDNDVKVVVIRGHGPANPAYRYVEIKDIGGLPGVVGL